MHFVRARWLFVRRQSLFILFAAVVLLLAPAALGEAPAANRGHDERSDVARYILPPGNYGGLPFTQNSTDQLPLYSGLTPLRDNVTDTDIDRFFLPEDFQPIGQTHEEQTGRPGLRLIYDSYGIPHIYGETRADVAFGAGWTTARDRQLLILLGRGPARAAVADIPNLDAFSLVTSGQSFVPSAQTEALVTRQRELLIDTYGDEGRQIIDDARAYADGVNAYANAHNINEPPATVNDVIAATAFIGSIFGAGGGGEAANADLLAKLRASLGASKGYEAWDDVMLADDQEAPTTIKKRFEYGPLTGGPVTGSVELDANSVQSIDPRQSPAAAAAAPAARGGGRRASAQGGVELAAHRASALCQRQHARRDGPAARLLLPRDRPADRPARARHQRPGNRRPGPSHVPRHRPHRGLRLEPDLGRARRARRLRRAPLRARRLGADPRLHPLRVQGGVPTVRELQRGPLERPADQLQGLGPRPGVRDGDGGRRALRALAPTLDLRA
jgi:Penicillin amidase